LASITFYLAVPRLIIKSFLFEIQKQGSYCVIHYVKREVFAPAIEQRDVAILVAHNHPSNINGGEITPSTEDIGVTRRLKQVGGILGITVIDHMIIGGESYYSMLEHEVL
jgi:DNA repair protein RadC